MSIPVIWTTAPAALELFDDEVHVWRANLDVGQFVLGRLAVTLAPDEKSRAARFHFERDHDHFVAARGILRELLGVYLNRPPSEVEFCYGLQGKPAVQTNGPDRPILFNLSHSHGLALYAFACGREVGIDIELIQPAFAGDETAEHFFSPREIAELRALPLESRTEGFFLCWTRKEAYVKAKGAGLDIPLDAFDVSLTPGQPVELISVDADRWSLRSFLPATGYAAAVVAEGKSWRLRHWKWMP